MLTASQAGVNNAPGYSISAVAAAAPRNPACVWLGAGGIKPQLLPGLTSSSQRVLFSGQPESGEAVEAAGH